jgi:protein-disulfide isomerase
VVFLQINSNPVQRGAYAQVAQQTASDGTPILGDPNAKIVLREFADFSCSHCLDYHPTIKQLIDKYVRTGQMRFEMRPLTFVGGQYSIMAAQAALCANKQKAFWDMSDAIWRVGERESPRAYELGRMSALATELGLNADNLVECITKGEMLPTLQSAQTLAQTDKVSATPTVFVSFDGGQTFRFVSVTNANGTKQDITEGAVPLELIEKFIQENMQR